MNPLKIFTTIMLMTLTINTYAVVEAKSVAQADQMLEEAQLLLGTKVLYSNPKDDIDGKIIATMINKVELQLNALAKELAAITSLEAIEESELTQIKEEIKETIDLIKAI